MPISGLLMSAFNILFYIIEILILVRVLLSWVPKLREGQFGYVVQQLTEPILGPVRQMIARSPFGRNMMLDFSPIVAYLLIRVLRFIIMNILARIQL